MHPADNAPALLALCARSYEAPDNYTNCVAALGPITTDNFAAAIQCETIYGQNNYHNSMLALDMTTGAIRWVGIL
jgi:glucose dehydrogenase